MEILERLYIAVWNVNGAALIKNSIDVPHYLWTLYSQIILLANTQFNIHGTFTAICGHACAE